MARDGQAGGGVRSLPAERWAAVGVAAAIALGGVGVWTLRSADPPVAPIGATVAVEGGQLRIDEVLPDVMGTHQVMPGGMMPDPVPEGMRRLHVHVSLLATAEAGLRYDAQDLVLEAAGLPPTPPRTSQLGDGEAPTGSTVAGRLTYDVPADADELVLRDAASGASIALGGVAEDPQDGHQH